MTITRHRMACRLEWFRLEWFRLERLSMSCPMSCLPRVCVTIVVRQFHDLVHRFIGVCFIGVCYRFALTVLLALSECKHSHAVPCRAVQACVTLCDMNCVTVRRSPSLQFANNAASTDKGNIHPLEHTPIGTYRRTRVTYTHGNLYIHPWDPLASPGRR